MPDPGFVSGFIGVGIDKAIQQILDRIKIAVRCNDELASLKAQVKKIVPVVKEIQQCRQAINRNKKDKASAVNVWLTELDGLLQQASKIVQHCTIPTCNLIYRYQTSLRITGLISDIEDHLKLSPLLVLDQNQEFRDEIRQTKETIEAWASSSASTSQGALASTGSANMKFIDEPLIVGQGNVVANVEKLMIADDKADMKIGVHGKGGSGKTLLLKTIFNREKVRNHFKEGLLLWLTVSQTPHVTSLMDDLCKQIAIQKNVVLIKDENREEVKRWLSQKLHESSRFALFLDNVWGADAGNLFEELGIQCAVSDHADCKVIVSARDRSALSAMGVEEKYTIAIQDLTEHDSWKLFARHAFPYNHGDPPEKIGKEKAKRLCDKCGGLPLAIKVVGKAMARSIYPQEWEWALQSLPEVDSVHACLRLSYDALGNDDVNLQFCFLYVAAFPEDKIIHAQEIILLWVGEGLHAKKILQDEHQLSSDPFDIGWTYLNLLSDRCLIEPISREVDGRIQYLRMHDLIRELAARIADEEETFYCRVGKSLKKLNENECGGRTRIFLGHNNLSSLPQFTSCAGMYSLSLSANKELKQIPGLVMRSMTSLKVLDLSWTFLESLPHSVGSLKQLVYLSLVGTHMGRLPPSITNLASLEILDLAFSCITELPSALHNLRSLRYLSLHGCRHLKYLPRSIAQVTSLQFLYMDKLDEEKFLYMNECSSMTTHLWGITGKKIAAINNLGSLIHLKRLALQNNGKTVREGTLGSMIEMETLSLKFTKMECLPSDMSNMLKLRRLVLDCCDLVGLDSKFCEFSELNRFTLYNCFMLKELPQLQKLRSLRRLDICGCSKLEKLPEEFGETRAFLSLELFSLVELSNLEKLPILKEGAMPSLQIFTIMECPMLKLLPKTYLKLKTLQKMRIFGCSTLVENSEDASDSKTTEKVNRISIEETQAAKEKFSSRALGKEEGWFYGEYWSEEFFLFLRGLNRLV